MADVAQLVERLVVVQEVAGSKPVVRPNTSVFASNAVSAS